MLYTPNWLRGEQMCSLVNIAALADTLPMQLAISYLSSHEVFVQCELQDVLQ